MKIRLQLILFLLFTTVLTNAQIKYLQVNSSIILPKDSIESKNILNSLENFLIDCQKPNEENKFVLEAEKVETFIMLDEIRGIEKNSKLKTDFFYKPYLTNVALLSESKYFIQVSYIGFKDEIPILRASFDMIAHKVNDTFLFSSMLKQNTKEWKQKIVNNNIFYYKNRLNKQKLKEFTTLSQKFDTKLKSKNTITEYYCTDNIIELQKLIGVSYKLDYNSQTESAWSSSYNSRKIIVLGDGNSEFSKFDSHDLWHDRLSLVISRKLVYKPVDEACAYLYGGSWGMSWKEILTSFKEKVANNKSIDWKEIKEKPYDFGESKEKHLMADYVVNALIIQKLENEKGFDAVWQLLNCGKWEKGNQKYYEMLEKLTGITINNYNEKVWQLIDAAQ